MWLMHTFSQVEARLRERKWGDGDEESLWSASKYAADLTLDALGEMFGSAKHIMAWLAGETCLLHGIL